MVAVSEKVASLFAVLICLLSFLLYRIQYLEKHERMFLMINRTITLQMIQQFEDYLVGEERSRATMEFIK